MGRPTDKEIHEQTILRISEVIPDACDDIKNELKGKLQTGLLTGFRDLDDFTHGLKRGSLYVVAGRPSMGKSIFTMNMIGNMLRQHGEKLAAVIFTLDRTDREWARLFLLSEAKIGRRSIKSSESLTEKETCLSEVATLLSNSNIHIDDTAALDVEKVRSKCFWLKKRLGKLDLVVIDYLQFMSPCKSASVRNELSAKEYPKALKELAVELDTPILIVSAISRSLEHRADKRPKVHDLLDTGTLDDAADLIFILYRDSVYNKKPENEFDSEIHVAKNKSGPTGYIRLLYNGNVPRFDNYTHTSFFEEDEKNGLLSE